MAHGNQEFEGKDPFKEEDKKVDDEVGCLDSERLAPPARNLHPAPGFAKTADSGGVRRGNPGCWASTQDSRPPISTSNVDQVQREKSGQSASSSEVGEIEWMLATAGGVSGSGSSSSVSSPGSSVLGRAPTVNPNTYTLLPPPSSLKPTPHSLLPPEKPTPYSLLPPAPIPQPHNP